MDDASLSLISFNVMTSMSQFEGISLQSWDVVMTSLECDVNALLLFRLSHLYLFTACINPVMS
jgi:hypothetical protein